MNLTDKVSEIQTQVARARDQHFQLVWLAGASSRRRSDLLRTLADAENGIFLELGKKLSSLLIEVPVPLRPASVEECFTDCLSASPDRLTCLDYLDILFEPSLRINPVSLVKGASRHTSIVASWPGKVSKDGLCFGPPDHPAHFLISERELESAIFIL